MEYLVLRLRHDATVERWAVFDMDGRALRGAVAEDASIADAARGRRVIALVPGVDVIGTTATLPKSSPARLRKMLPYSLEDVLAEDIENLFFAVGPRLESGAVAVAVVARELLDAWLAALHAEGVVPYAVYSDAEGVPDTPSTLTLVIEGERVYGRAPGSPAFVFDGLSLDEVLDALGAQHSGAEPRHALVFADEAGARHYSRDFDAVSRRMASADVKILSDGAFFRLGATVTVRPATNLLQGSYAPKSNWTALARPWRAAASLLVGFVLLLVIAEGVQLVSLRQQDRSLTEALTAACSQSFGAARMSACESEVRSRLGGSGLLETSPNGFLTALSTVAVSRGPQSRLEALSYRNRVMDLQLVVPDIPALDALAQEIESGQLFDVVIQSASPGDAGVESRVQLVGADR